MLAQPCGSARRTIYIRIRYPYAPEETLRSHNAEAMFLTPGGAPVIVTKRTNGESRVFLFDPLGADPRRDPARVQYVGTMAAPQVIISLMSTRRRTAPEPSPPIYDFGAVLTSVRSLSRNE